MKNVLRNCPVCANGEGEILHSQHFAVPDGCALPGSYDVVACCTCGMIYADTPATQEAYDRYYAAQSIYQAPAATSASATTPAWDLLRLRTAARCIARATGGNTAARILDIGCANGGLLQALQSEGFHDLTGVDPAEACVANTRSLGFAALRGELSSLPSAGRYDVVILTAVMEHVLDVQQAVQALEAICSEKGMIFLEVPDAAYYAKYLHAPFQDFNTEHINHFSRASLRNLMRHIGFRAVLEESVAIPGPSDLEFPSLYGVYSRDTARVKGWEIDEVFRHGIERYISQSHQVMQSLDSQLRAVLPPDRQPVVVYGAGQLAMKLLRDTALRDARIHCFADGNPVKAGQTINGVPVVTPDKIDAPHDAPIIVSTLLHAGSIRSRLAELGIPNPVFTLHTAAQATEFRATSSREV